MLESTAAAQVSSPARKKNGALQPWERQPYDTKDLWWYRFLCYLALGPKRSVSQVAMGRRNAYPIPAHWPIQAKQLNWKARADAFDVAAAAKPGLIVALNDSLRASSNGILKSMRDVVRAFAADVIKEGYKVLPPDEYDEPPPPKPKPERPEPPLISPVRPLNSGA